MKRTAWILVLGLALTTTMARAADGTWDGDASPARLSLVVPLWLPFLSMESSSETELEFENVETESEVSWVVIGSLEAGYKALAARVDVFGIGFEDQLMRSNGETTEVVVESGGFVGRGIVMYEFGPWMLGKRWRQVSVSPVAGARYNSVSLETGERTDLEGTYDWIDPLVGARCEFRLRDWRIDSHVDVGGFGVGSDLAFWAAVSVEYLFKKWFGVWLGWQHYRVLFEDTSEDEVSSLKLLLTGPSAGLSFHIF